MHSVMPSSSRSSSAIRSGSVPSRRPRFGPVCPLRHPILRQPCKFRPHLVERQPDLLREDDEGNDASTGPRIAPMSGTGALGVDQAGILVKPQGRGGNTGLRATSPIVSDSLIRRVCRRFRLTSSALEVRTLLSRADGPPFWRGDMGRSNRVAVVTGASRGLGRVIAGVLAAQGVDLVVGARHPTRWPKQPQS